MADARTVPWWARFPWSWLCSLKFGLILLAMLGMASILGTLISPLARAQALVYHNPAYQGLLLLLALSLACTTLRTISLKILPPAMPRFMRAPDFYSTAGAVALDAPQPLEAAAAALRRRGWRVWVEGDHAYALRGNLQVWGAPLAHGGLLILLLAGFASAWLAQEGMVRIEEGHSVTHFDPAGAEQSGEPLGFELACNDFDIQWFPRTEIPSRFASEVHAVGTGLAPQPGVVEVNGSLVIDGWELHQTGYEPRPEARRFAIELHGLGAGEAPQVLEVSAGQRRAIPGTDLTLELAEEPPHAWTIREGTRAERSGVFPALTADLTLRAEQLVGDFMLDATGQVVSRSATLRNPAVRVALEEQGKPLGETWLFLRDEFKAKEHRSDLPYDLELVELSGSAGFERARVRVTRRAGDLPLGEVQLGLGETRALPRLDAGPPPATVEPPPQLKLRGRVPAYTTVLSLTRNPALPWAYAGCVVLCVGLVVTFGLRRRELWLGRDPRNGITYAVMGQGSRYVPPDAATLGALQKQPAEPAHGAKSTAAGRTAGKVLLLTALLLLGAASVRAAEPPLTAEMRAALRPLRALPVQHNGFVRSLFGFGRERLEAISGRGTYAGLEGYELCLWLSAFPEERMKQPLLKVDHPRIVEFLGARHVSLAAYRSQYTQQKIVELYQSDPASLLKPLNALEMRARALEAIGDDLALLPTPEGIWLAPEAMPADSGIVAAWGRLMQAMQSGAAADAGVASQALLGEAAAVAQRTGQAKLTQPRSIALDVAYHRWRPFAAAGYLYLLAALAAGGAALSERLQRGLLRAGTLLLLAGLICHGAGLAMRWMLAGRAPLSNMFESFTFSTAGLVLLAFCYSRRHRLVLPVAAVLGSCFMVLAHHAPIFDPAIHPLRPALQSSWLTYHVTAMMLSYAAFTLSFAVSVLYLIRDVRGLPLAGRLPSLDALDVLNYRIIAVGFPLLTIGIILGAVWADTAWGRPWGFDPKETWSAITWMIYAIYLHARVQASWRGRTSAVLAVLGFAAVVFTYLGVNYLLSGLHSYA